MSGPPNLELIGWMLFTLLVSACNIYAATLLIRERSLGPALMLGGAVLAAVGSLGTHGILLTSNWAGQPVSTVWMRVSSALGAFGWFCLSLGLLLFAIRRVSQAARIAELEAILEARRSADERR